MDKDYIRRLFVAAVTMLGALVLMTHAVLIKPWLGIGVFIWIVTQWRIPLEPLEELIRK